MDKKLAVDTVTNSVDLHAFATSEEVDAKLQAYASRMTFEAYEKECTEDRRLLREQVKAMGEQVQALHDKTDLQTAILQKIEGVMTGIFGDPRISNGLKSALLACLAWIAYWLSTHSH